MPPGISGLKRHAALLPLSRDHHGALVQARALRLAAGGTDAERRLYPAAPTARGFLDFYEGELRGHIADEERALLPRCREANPSGADRILEEHRELEALIAAIGAALNGGEDPSAPMAQAGQLLDDHVRFEERSFFEGLQRTLSADALKEIGRAIEANRATRGVAMSCALPAPTRGGG
jgi:hemerythrin-like domain-containing protein